MMLNTSACRMNGMSRRILKNSIFSFLPEFSEKAHVRSRT
jgi:hypothetical protein